MTFRFEFTAEPREFLERAEAYLAAAPVVHTVVTTNAHRAAAGGVRPPHPRWWVSVLDESGAVVGAAMRTAPFAPYPVYVLPMPDETARQVGGLLVERDEAYAGFHPAADRHRPPGGAGPVAR